MILHKKIADEERLIGEAPTAERQQRLEWEAGVLKRKWEVRVKLIYGHIRPKLPRRIC